MENETKRPELTVIAAAVDDYATIAEALSAVEDQTAREELELLVVLDSMERFAAPADFASRHPRARIIETGRPLLLNEARAIGIAHAAAEWVFLLEDHSLPARESMAAIIARIREGRWSVIGPAIESGNRHSSWARAANLLTYGEWMGFDHAEERDFVAGYNSAWRCAPLRQLPAAELERDIAIPSRLQQRLRESGERLFFEPRAIMFHWESSYHRGVCRILIRQGLGMGYVRQGASSFGGKLLATLRYPALVAWRTLRGAAAWWRADGKAVRVLLALPWLSVVWTSGELAGYWKRRPDAVLGGLSDVERQRQPLIDPEWEPIRRPWARE